jgi:hypothetical protein
MSGWRWLVPTQGSNCCGSHRSALSQSIGSSVRISNAALLGALRLISER